MLNLYGGLKEQGLLGNRLRIKEVQSLRQRSIELLNDQLHKGSSSSVCQKTKGIKQIVQPKNITKTNEFKYKNYKNLEIERSISERKSQLKEKTSSSHLINMGGQKWFDISENYHPSSFSQIYLQSNVENKSIPKQQKAISRQGSNFKSQQSSLNHINFQKQQIKQIDCASDPIIDDKENQFYMSNSDLIKKPDPNNTKQNHNNMRIISNVSFNNILKKNSSAYLQSSQFPNNQSYSFKTSSKSCHDIIKAAFKRKQFNLKVQLTQRHNFTNSTFFESQNKQQNLHLSQDFRPNNTQPSNKLLLEILNQNQINDFTSENSFANFKDKKNSISKFNEKIQEGSLYYQKVKENERIQDQGIYNKLSQEYGISDLNLKDNGTSDLKLQETSLTQSQNIKNQMNSLCMKISSSQQSIQKEKALLNQFENNRDSINKRSSKQKFLTSNRQQKMIYHSKQIKNSLPLVNIWLNTSTSSKNKLKNQIKHKDKSIMFEQCPHNKSKNIIYHDIDNSQSALKSVFSQASYLGTQFIHTLTKEQQNLQNMNQKKIKNSSITYCPWESQFYEHNLYNLNLQNTMNDISLQHVSK